MTDDDAKEWVTVKVPKADREASKDARPDDASHGDCLVAGAKALAGGDEREEDTQEKVVAEIREKLGLDGDVDIPSIVAEDAAVVDGEVDFEPFYDAEEIADAVADELDTDAMQLDAADIIGRIEDLENSLPRKVAEELGSGR